MPEIQELWYTSNQTQTRLHTVHNTRLRGLEYFPPRKNVRGDAAVSEPKRRNFIGPIIKGRPQEPMWKIDPDAKMEPFICQARDR